MLQKDKDLKVCFAASSGGHLQQLMMMKPLMDKYDSFIVTEKTDFAADTKGIPVHYLAQINRKEWEFPFLLIKNIFCSLRVLHREKPDVVVTTGVLAVIPMCLFMKLAGKTVIFVESFANVNKGTLTGKLMYRFADRFYIQWEDLQEIYPKAEYIGGIY